MPGYCGGITLGRWQDLDSMVEEGIEMDNYPVLGFLISDNLQGLFNFAKDLGYRELQKGYLSKCDLCLDLRTYLVSQKDFPELAPKELYEYL